MKTRGFIIENSKRTLYYQFDSLVDVVKNGKGTATLPKRDIVNLLRINLQITPSINVGVGKDSNDTTKSKIASIYFCWLLFSLYLQITIHKPCSAN